MMDVEVPGDSGSEEECECKEDGNSHCTDFLKLIEKNIWDPAHIFARRATFHSKIEEYFKDGKYTDVNIICQDQVFKCHRLALAAASEYFDTMFGGNFKESSTQEVVLHQIDSVTFEKVLLFVYKGEIVTINDDNVYNLLQASEILQLSEIEDHCVHYLTQKKIPMTCALDIHLFASATNKMSLIRATSRFILQHLDHFCQDTKFLTLPSEEMSTILSYFRASSPNQEKNLLNAIFQHVFTSTNIPADRRSSFMELVQRVQFKSISAEYIAEYVDQHLSDDSGTDCIEMLSVTTDLDSKIKNDELSLHVYVGCNAKKPTYESLFMGCDADQSSIFSLQKSSNTIDWHHSHTIKPSIRWMRSIELDSRLYSLRCHEEDWVLSVSAAIDLSTGMQSLTPPSGLAVISASGIDDHDYARSSVLCCLDNRLYLSGLLGNEDLHHYNPELDAWSKIPSISKMFRLEQIVSDDTRLYMLCSSKKTDCSSLKLAAYDPRNGKLEKLNNSGLTHLYPELFYYHKDKIYVSEDNTGENHISTCKMAIYDPLAGRWDVQNLESNYMGYSTGHRLVSFDDQLWMFRFHYTTIFTQIYDSFLQKWDTSKSDLLNNAIRRSNMFNQYFTDVIAFKSL